MRTGTDWYKGSADAIYQNLNLITDEGPDLVYVFGADHVYMMDVRQMERFHRERKAEMTVAAIPVPIEEADQFGVIEVAEDGRVKNFLEKPKNPPPMPGDPTMVLASMGNYLFNADALVREVTQDAKTDGSHDFGRKHPHRDVQPLRRCTPTTFRPTGCPGQGERERGYWRDVGTIDAYFHCNMDLVAVEPIFNLYNAEWPIYTHHPDLPPAKFVFANFEEKRVGHATDSLVSEGCIVSGSRVDRSVLSPKVRVNSYSRGLRRDPDGERRGGPALHHSPRHHRQERLHSPGHDDRGRPGGGPAPLLRHRERAGGDPQGHEGGVSARARWVAAAGLSLWAAGVQLTEALAVTGLALAGLGLALQWRTLEKQPRRLLKENAALLAFVAWGLLGPLLAGERFTGTGLARLADWLWVPLAAGALGSLTQRQRRLVAFTAVGTLLVSCLAAGLQHYGVWPRVELFEPLRFTRLAFERVYEPAPNDPGRFMAGGLAFHRLRFSNVTVLLAAFLSALPKGRWQWPARAVAVVAVVAVVLFPLARAAAAAGLAGIAVAWVLAAERRGRALAAAGGLAILAGVLVASSAGLRARLASSLTGEGSGERAVLLESGLAAIRAHPVVGVGAGRFRPSLYAPPDAPKEVLEHPGKAHDQFVSIAAELGLPGLLFFLAVLFVEARRHFRAGRAGAPGLALLFTFALLCLLHDPLFHSELSLGLVLALGAARVLSSQAPAPAASAASAAGAQSS